MNLVKGKHVAKKVSEKDLSSRHSSCTRDCHLGN